MPVTFFVHLGAFIMLAIGGYLIQRRSMFIKYFKEKRREKRQFKKKFNIPMNPLDYTSSEFHDEEEETSLLLTEEK